MSLALRARSPGAVSAQVTVVGDRPVVMVDIDADVAVSKAHRFAGRNAIDPKDLAGERLIVRTDCEVTDDFTNFLQTQQVHPKISHKLVSEQDYLVLLEANLGVGVMPESAVRSTHLSCVPVSGLDLSRTVSLYAVVGRQRSAAASTFIKLLRSSDWPAQIGTHLLSQGEAV